MLATQDSTRCASLRHFSPSVATTEGSLDLEDFPCNPKDTARSIAINPTPEQFSEEDAPAPTRKRGHSAAFFLVDLEMSTDEEEEEEEEDDFTYRAYLDSSSDDEEEEFECAPMIALHEGCLLREDAEECPNTLSVNKMAASNNDFQHITQVFMSDIAARGSIYRYCVGAGAGAL